MKKCGISPILLKKILGPTQWLMTSQRVVFRGKPFLFQLGSSIWGLANYLAIDKLIEGKTKFIYMGCFAMAEQPHGQCKGLLC